MTDVQRRPSRPPLFFCFGLGFWRALVRPSAATLFEQKSLQSVEPVVLADVDDRAMLASAGDQPGRRKFAKVKRQVGRGHAGCVRQNSGGKTVGAGTHQGAHDSEARVLGERAEDLNGLTFGYHFNIS